MGTFHSPLRVSGTLYPHSTENPQKKPACEPAELLFQKKGNN